MNNTTPYIATHPGELIRDEMRERGLTQRQLASLAGLTPSMVSALVNARCNVTEDIAAALEKALGIPVVHDLAEQANMRENVVVTIPVSDRNLLRDLSRKFGWACMM